MYNSPQPPQVSQPSVDSPQFLQEARQLLHDVLLQLLQEEPLQPLHGLQATGLNATGPQGAFGPIGTVPAQPVKQRSAVQYNAIESRLTNDII
jgi:hypothetical protein